MIYVFFQGQSVASLELMLQNVMRVDLASIDNFENSWLLLFPWQINYFIIQYFTIALFAKIKKLLTIIIIIIIIMVIIIIIIIIIAIIIIITRIMMIIKY